RDARWRGIPVPLTTVGAPQPAHAATARDCPRRAPAATCAVELVGRLCPSDHRLARIRARHLLAADASLCQAQCIGCRVANSALLLDRRARYALSARGNPSHDRPRLRAPYRALDGTGAVLSAAGCATVQRASLAHFDVCGRDRLGVTAEHAWHEPAR